MSLSPLPIPNDPAVCITCKARCHVRDTKFYRCLDKLHTLIHPDCVVKRERRR